MQNDALFANAMSDAPSLIKRLTDEFNEAYGDFSRDPRAFIASAIRGDGRENRRRRTLLKFGLAVGIVFYAVAFAAMLIFWVAGHSERRIVNRDIIISDWWTPIPGSMREKLPEDKNRSGGGGGGGNEEKTQASQGELPPYSMDQPINAPTTRPQLEPPLLPIQPIVVVDPNLQPRRDELAPMGIPDGAVGPPSDGPGKEGGIGPGKGGGVGPGNGIGVGPGNRWGINGGDPVIGGNLRERDAQPQVDSRPIALNRPRPNYTEEARKNKVSGTVRVRVLVGADGTVKEVKIVTNLPDGLSNEAIQAAYQMRFRPATKDGRAVAFWIPVDIEFNLR